MKILTQIAWVLVIIGGLNWGLIGIFDWNLVGSLFGVAGLISRLIYTFVGISAIWLIIDLLTAKAITRQK